MKDEGVGASAAGQTPRGRALEWLVLPPTQVRRTAHPAEGGSRGDEMLFCHGQGVPPAEVGPLTDPLVFRLRTGDLPFDLHVSVRTRESLPWLMALDGVGRAAVRRAVQAGWSLTADVWVLPWSRSAGPVPEEVLRAVDDALDALAPERTTGRQRWLETMEASDQALRRAQLVQRAAQNGWLSSQQARIALEQERQPLVRLALYALFLPSTVPEVAAGLRASDGEIVGLAAVALAHTQPRGALREQVERCLLDLLDTTLEGLFVALSQVGGSATLHALEQRVGTRGPWRGARRDAGIELLTSLQAQARSRGAAPGGVSIVEGGGEAGGLSVAPEGGDSPERLGSVDEEDPDGDQASKHCTSMDAHSQGAEALATDRRSH